MKETGFSEDFIMNQLPLSKGLQYRHAILRSYDVETFYEADDSEIEDNMNLFESILNQPFDDQT